MHERVNIMLSVCVMRRGLGLTGSLMLRLVLRRGGLRRDGAQKGAAEPRVTDASRYASAPWPRSPGLHRCVVLPP